MKRVVALIAAAALLGVCIYWLFGGRAGHGNEGPKMRRPMLVEAVKPVRQAFERTTVQPGSLMPYESVEVYSEVAGTLKTLKVDLGDPIKKGQLLAEIDVPEVRKQKEKAAAQITLAKARVTVANKGVKRAEADYEVAKASVKKAEKQLKAFAATTRARNKELERMEALVKGKGLDDKLRDEAEERRDAAVATEEAGAVAVTTAKAQKDAAWAKVEQAKADVTEAEANEKVAVAEEERIDVLLGFSKIHAPFNGRVTRRYVSEGAFIRSGRLGAAMPIVSLDRTDLLRCVVQIPDRDVPHADAGDTADIEIDTLRGKKYKGKICRTQEAEDPQTRTMRIEIDLKNRKDERTGKDELRPGMFGKVTIALHRSGEGLTLPSDCLLGDVTEGGKAQVIVVRDGRAYTVPVEVGIDNGLLVEIKSGLTDQDLVVRRYTGVLPDGVEVKVAE
jgi:RND family efflux transporter MFP subunit